MRRGGPQQAGTPQATVRALAEHVALRVEEFNTWRDAAYPASAARGVAGMHKAYAGNDPQARERARENAWEVFEPCETLKRLIKVGRGEDRRGRRQCDAQAGFTRHD